MSDQQQPSQPAPDIEYCRCGEPERCPYAHRHDCDQGWVCEEHPEQPFRHDGCDGAGMPCRYSTCQWMQQSAPEAGVADMMQLHGYTPEITATNQSNPRAPAPAGWPSDEAVEHTITEGALVCCLDLDESVARVQRLYAPLRERLARLEAALADTPDNRAAVLTAYFGTYTPEDLNRMPGKCAAKVLAYLCRAALQGGSHDAA